MMLSLLCHETHTKADVRHLVYSLVSLLFFATHGGSIFKSFERLILGLHSHL